MQNTDIHQSEAVAAAERACAATRQAMDSACEAMSEARTALDHSVSSGIDCAAQAAREQPLRSMGMAAGAGLLIGLLLSRV